MSLKRLIVALLAVSVASPGVAATLAPEPDTVEVTQWPAPPFWSPSAEGASASTSGGQAFSGLTKIAVATLPSTPMPFVAMAPCRQYDSRLVSPLLNNTPRTIGIVGAPCGIPANAEAVSVNITIFNITGAIGASPVFQVGPDSTTLRAWINYQSTTTQSSNAGTISISGGGTIAVNVKQGGGSVDFTVDVNGYYSPLGIVNSLAGLSGALTLTAGPNVTITPSVSDITISASAPAGPAGPTGATGLTGPAGPTGATGAPAFFFTAVSFADTVALDEFVTVGAPIAGLTEAQNSVVWPASCTLNLRVQLDLPTGSATPISYALRVNGVDSLTSTCVLAGSSTDCTTFAPLALTAGNRVTLHQTGPVNYGAATAIRVAGTCQ